MLDVHDNKNNSFNNRLVIAWQATIIVQGAKQATKIHVTNFIRFYCCEKAEAEKNNINKSS